MFDNEVFDRLRWSVFVREFCSVVLRSLVVGYVDRRTNVLKNGRMDGLESLEFFIELILPVALWPWGRLSL